ALRPHTPRTRPGALQTRRDPPDRGRRARTRRSPQRTYGRRPQRDALAKTAFRGTLGRAPSGAPSPRATASAPSSRLPTRVPRRDRRPQRPCRRWLGSLLDEQLPQLLPQRDHPRPNARLDRAERQLETLRQLRLCQTEKVRLLDQHALL